MSNSNSRPLSPHLSIYKFEPSMVMSLLHRVTGVALTVGLVLLTWWLVAAAAGPDYFSVIQGLLGTWIGKLALFGWTFSIFYHLGTGLRHLVFDTGRCMTKEWIERSGWIAVAGAVGLTLLAWIVGFIA